jgi:hypothetical protein
VYTKLMDFDGNGEERTLRFHLGEYCIGKSDSRKWTTRKGIVRAPMAKGHATGTQRQRMESEKMNRCRQVAPGGEY